MPRPRLPSWPTTLTTLAVLTIHLLVLWLLADLLFNRPPTESITPGPYLISALILSTLLLPILILALRGRRPRGQRHCPHCWYILDPALGLKCPECGHEAASDRQTRKPRRRYKLAAATLCLITLCQLTWLETRIRQGGWLALVPTEALIIGMPWVPTHWLESGNSLGRANYALFNRYHRMGRWQKRLAANRLAVWLLATDDPETLSERCSTWGTTMVLFSVDDEHRSRLVVHALDRAIEGAAASRDSDSMGQLIDFSAEVAIRWDIDHGHGAPLPHAVQAIDSRTDKLLSAQTRQDIHRRPLCRLLTLGRGDPEVVEFLLAVAGEKYGRPDDDFFFAAKCLLDLATRHDAVADALGRIISTKDHSARGSLANAIEENWRLGTSPPKQVEAALAHMLDSVDIEELLIAIRLLASCSNTHRDRAIRLGLRVIEEHPDHADWVAQILIPYGAGIRQFGLELQRMSQSSDPAVREASGRLLGPLNSPSE